MSRPSQDNPQPPQPTFLWPIGAIVLAALLAIALIVLAVVQQTATPASSADAAATVRFESATLTTSAVHGDTPAALADDEIAEVYP